jgi:cytoskeletal protein CcmA (bactofilin family)
VWNRRNEDAHPPAQTKDRSPAMTGTSLESSQRMPVRAGAIIGETMRINGEIHAQEDLYIGGEVDGKLESVSSLTVGPNAKIKANIKARDVTIHGTVRGSVEVTDKIIIHQNGSLVGDIKTAGIVIDDGAYFKGSIDIVRPPRNLPEASEAPAPQREAVAAQHK